MYLDAQEISQKLTQEDIIKICSDLGNGMYEKDNEGHLIFSTELCHEDGDSMKLYLYENTESKMRWMFHCYTCADTYDIYELVIRARRKQGITISFPQAVKYVANISNNVFYKKDHSIQEEKIDDWNWINRLKSSQNKKSIPQLSEINEHILEVFCPYPHEIWLEEGIGKDSMKKYQISYWGEQNKIIIPHRDIDGRLIGIRGRALNKSDLEAKRKYMPITIQGKVLKHTLGNNLYGLCQNEEAIKRMGKIIVFESDLEAKRKYMPITIQGKVLKHTLGNNLYGLCQNEEAIKRMGKIIVFESEKSVLLCDTYYQQNNFSVAVCGSNITDTQCRMIRALGVSEVIIAFDKEYENAKSKLAEAYYNKLLKLAYKLTPYCTVYLLMDTEDLLKQKDSPADRGKEILEKLMKSKIEVRKEE